MRISGDFTGLALVAPTGTAWHWVGHKMLTTRYGALVRVEKWRAPCRACGVPFTVLAKLPAGLRQRFYVGRIRAQEARQAIDVQLATLPDRPIKGFQLRNCRAHRGQVAPPADGSDLV